MILVLFTITLKVRPKAETFDPGFTIVTVEFDGYQRYRDLPGKEGPITLFCHYDGESRVQSRSQE
jgi:hypothetical protein